MNKERRVLAVPSVTPFPPKPDISLYQHLTEKERMVSGFPYVPFDAELVAIRKKARVLQRKFNEADEDDLEGKREALRQLFHPACKDNNIYFEPSLRVDYGENIIIGDNFQANYNCILLDCARIEIGDNCLMAPNVQLYTATHDVDALSRQGDGYYEYASPIKVGDNCWFGGMSVVLPGVTIGNNVVIGAVSIYKSAMITTCSSNCLWIFTLIFFYVGIHCNERYT